MRKTVKTYLLSVLFFCSTLAVFAQGENNIWYFSDYAGLDFNGGAPVPITDGQIKGPPPVNGTPYPAECASVICDAAGNLLFYTDGSTVWNKNHLVMQGGTGLMSSSSSTQGALIIKLPESLNMYYIFTLAPNGLSNGFRYSVVDMSLASNLGAVVQKNVPIYTPSCEKMAAYKHCNERDIWIVTHEWNSSNFRSYLLTPTGLDMNPVISNSTMFLGPVAGRITSALGQMKISRDGKKLAMAIMDSTINRGVLYEFDNYTGTVFNPVLLPKYTTPRSGFGAYGVEFSADSKKLYASISKSQGELFQYNICAGSPSAIIASQRRIAGGNFQFCALQLGPDDKIYMAKWNSTSLGVINNPNAMGQQCNFVLNGRTLAGRRVNIGLPTLYKPNMNPIEVVTPQFTTSINCLNVSFHSPVLNPQGEGDYCLNGIDTLEVTYEWNFGDSISNLPNPQYTYTESGRYPVQLVINYRCNTDTLIQDIVVQDCDFRLYYPNSFTPNDDGVNDLFTMATTGISKMHLQIFDRWGSMVFDAGEQINPVTSIPWDGKHKKTGQLLPLDVYVWRVKYTNYLQEEKEELGHVTIIR